MKDKTLLFFKVVFKSYGQIFFCNSIVIGFLFFLATFYNPVMGFTGLVGVVSANAAGLIFLSYRPYLKAGLFGCNGVLTGLAWGCYVSVSWQSILILAALSILCSIMTIIFIDMLSKKYDLPVLSVMFVITAWIGILAINGFDSDSIKLVHNSYTINAAVEIERVLSGIFPEFINLFFRVLGSTFFQGNVLTGFIFFLCILFYSRISAVFACLGGLISILTAHFLFGDIYKVLETSIGFNCILVSLVFGGAFVVLNFRSFIYTIFAVIMGFIIGSFSIQYLKFFNLPVLAFPFNLTALLFLYPLKIGFKEANKIGIYHVPLVEVSSPEEALTWFNKKKSFEERQKVRLSLPFFGTWFVRQGNTSKPTHNDAGAYAWDFVVIDDERVYFSGSGVKNENYFCFGLPVLAPADGKIVKAVNHIHDNEPGETNKEENWGNCVIISHGNDEYSEISHLRENSVIVKEGDFVSRGQFLGYCGNSGMSAEPHIHYQLQSGANLGADTINAVFTNYIKGKDISGLIKSGIPQEGDFVRNYEEKEL